MKRAIAVAALALALLTALSVTGCGGNQDCVVLAHGGNKLCGSQAAAWCRSTDAIRGMLDGNPYVPPTDLHHPERFAPTSEKCPVCRPLLDADERTRTSTGFPHTDLNRGIGVSDASGGTSFGFLERFAMTGWSHFSGRLFSRMFSRRLRWTVCAKPAAP